MDSGAGGDHRPRLCGRRRGKSRDAGGPRDSSYRVLAAHNSIDDVPLSALARAVEPDGVDVFVQHVRLGPNAPTGWHTHPGPALVTVIRGSLTYQDSKANGCRQVTYAAGSGFGDRGFGHVHRAIAGPDGADFYVVYLLPPASETHVIPASAPEACS